ncbi:hypothetical protein SGM_5430 [Streptomyces griseoaurantiacus M045]|uniref:Uncharacterized protein n=1 Tax=Streptomyces griseoaurantiacus M045 TaxID=996637 RepID=F3NPU5_9ACTN|nr:DUF3040 domain-containing protein [Streptomyces griseoaurantiacus]EGG44615.1 hypothetical protein SGM_5430 [Streptomyces griseoaurantiacus M045]
MTTGRIPDHEKRILEDMEAALRRDNRRLDRRLRTLRVRRGPDPRRLAAYEPRVAVVAVWLCVAVALMVTGICTGEPPVIWAFAVVWPVALYGVFRLLCRRAGP